MIRDGEVLLNLDLASYMKGVERVVDDNLLRTYAGYASRDLLDFEPRVKDSFSSNDSFKTVVNAAIKCSSGPITIPYTDETYEGRLITVRKLNADFDQRKLLGIHALSYIIRRNVDIFFMESGARSMELLGRGYMIAAREFGTRMGNSPTIYDITREELYNDLNAFASAPSLKPF